MICSLTRQQLNQQHQLSHEQIDAILDHREAEVFPEDKALTLKKLNGFLEVTDALRKAGIAFIPLKGFVLSQKIYGDATTRITGDIDLLLDPSDIIQAISALNSMGFVSAQFPWPSSHYQQQRLIRFRNQFALENNEKELVVELHWRLFYYPVLPPAQMNLIVNENNTTIDMHGRSFSVLNHELDLLFLIVHGGMHGWRRLKWLVDVHEIVRRKLFNEKQFGQLVATFSAQRMVGLYNELAVRWFNPGYTLSGAEKSTSLLLQIAQNKILDPREGEYHSVGGLLRYFQFVLAAFPGLGYKLRIIWYACRSLLNQGGPPLGLLLPFRFLRKRYGV